MMHTSRTTVAAGGLVILLAGAGVTTLLVGEIAADAPAGAVVEPAEVGRTTQRGQLPHIPDAEWRWLRQQKVER